MSRFKIIKRQALDVLEILLSLDGVSAAGITGKLARTGEGNILNLIVLLRDDFYSSESGKKSHFQKFSSHLREEIKKLYRCKCDPWDDSGWAECEFCTGSWEGFFESEEAMDRYYTKRQSELVLDVLLSSLQLNRPEMGWWELATRGIPEIRVIVLPENWKPEGYERRYDELEIEDLYPHTFNLSRMVEGVHGAYRLPYPGTGLDWRPVNWSNHPRTWVSFW